MLVVTSINEYIIAINFIFFVNIINKNNSIETYTKHEIQPKKNIIKCTVEGILNGNSFTARKPPIQTKNRKNDTIPLNPRYKFAFLFIYITY